MARVLVRIRRVVPSFGRGLRGLGQNPTNYSPGFFGQPSSASSGSSPGTTPSPTTSLTSGIVCPDGSSPPVSTEDTLLIALGLESVAGYCATAAAKAQQAAAQQAAGAAAANAPNAAAILAAQGFTPAQIAQILGIGAPATGTTDWTTIAIVGALGLLGVVAASGALK